MTQPDLARLEGLVAKARGLPLRQINRERRHETATSGVETWSEAIADREGNEQFAHCADDDDCSLIVAAANALPALLARVRELEKRNAGMAEALEPFARDYEDAGVDHLPDDARFGEVDCDQGQLTVGHLRRARAALTLNKENNNVG